MQAATSSTSSSHHVSPISCPPQEKPQVTLADVLRGGAENDRRSLQAYLHTLAAREKEKRKRKRNDRKSKRSSSSASSKRRKRSEEELLNAAAGSTSSSGSLDATSSANSTPSGSIDMSANMMMRGSVDLSAMRLASNEYDMGAHHMRSRSVDFGALRSSTAAFDAMRASLDMSAMGPGLGLGQHYSHHGSFAGYQHHGSFHHPSARASCDFDATGFGADISPTSSFSMEAGPVFLEPAPLASFSVDEHSPQQQQNLHQQQMMMNHGGASFQQPQPVQQMHMSYPQQPAQQAQVVTDLPDFEDFVSSAFLQAFPDQPDPALLLEPGVPEQQPSPEAPAQAPAAPVFAVPAPPQHFQQRQQSQHYHPPAQQQHHHHQAQPSCSCPDCHVTPVHSSSTQQHGNNSYAGAAAGVDENSLGQAGFVGVEEDQVENFLAQFIEWSEQRGVASPSSASSPAVSSPATSLYY